MKSWNEQVIEAVARCESMITSGPSSVSAGDFGSGYWAGYAARAAEGLTIPGYISAKTEMQHMARKLYKACKHGDEEARIALRLFDAEYSRLFPTVEEKESD